MADKRLQSFDSGSHYDFTGNLDKAPVKRSLFNLGHSLSMSFPGKSFGKLVPVFCMETLPTDDIQLSLNVLLRCLPVELPIYSKQRVTFHAFYADASSLWQNAEVYYRKGNTGNTVLRKPTLNRSNCSKMADADALVGYESLIHYLYGIPGYVKLSQLENKINALPLFMYWKIWQSYYMNRNLYMQNKVNLPDDFSRLRLNDSGVLLSALDDGQYSFELNSWRWRDFPDDRFTGAFPFPQRGDAPTLDYHFDGFAPIVSKGSDGTVGDITQLHVGASSGATAESVTFKLVGNYGGAYNEPTILTLTNNAGVHISASRDMATEQLYAKVSNENVSIGIGLNDIRRLACAQTELERMARTDGSYAEFGITFFGTVPRNTRSYDVSFIGGAYKDIFYNEVIQTAQPSAENGPPLGSYAGHGIMSLESNRGFVGQVRTSDYGYLMVLMSVMPDVIYSQGLDRAWTRLTQADEYLPDRARLGMQPIYNRELAFFGDWSPGGDNDLFAYDDAFNEFRFKSNRLLGKLSDPTSNSFWPYTQSRYFPPDGSHPTYSQDFATTEGNVRDEYLCFPEETPFHMDISFNVRAVRPLPYKSKPAQII